MGAGAYLASKSEREVYEAEVSRERHELEADPDEELTEASFPNPIRSTLSATASTAIGGFISIIPFFFTVGMPAVIASFVISTAAHFAVGASKSLVTTRSWWASGAEMTAVGVIEAAITYGLGAMFAGHAG
jgi:VIT1/CCC1 family predicted Fe2+/Mn2+ transporter